MDCDGYPTDEELSRIRAWPAGDRDGLLEYIRDNAWVYDDYIDRDGDRWWLSTGGWSGHEDVIAAMHDNHVWWSMHFYSLRRGGHYRFGPHDEDAWRGER